MASAPPISPARSATYDVLLRVETRDSYAAELLHSNLLNPLSAADRGLTTELVMGVLRWQRKLDQAVEAAAAKPITKFDVEVKLALRIGAYQLLYLDRIPPRAAVNESVELVKLHGKRSAAPLVNAVLRKLSRDIFDASPQKQHDDVAGIYSHPAWLVERWIRTYGAEAARAICGHNQERPKITIRTSSPEVLEELSRAGITVEPAVFVVDAWRVKSGDVTQTRAYHDGHLTIQDEASQLVALLVGRGNSILDCCAAPGGKTRIMAEKNPNATVVAMDLHPHRANLLRRLAPESNIQVIAADARHMPFATTFDRILVDAPCSGTGTLARNPEIKWRLTPEDILRLQAYQIEILTAAMKHVAKRGRIIYSTCSLEPEENEAVIEKAMASERSFKVVDCGGELRRLATEGELVWEAIESLLSGPYLRTIPGVHPCDGFFAAVLEQG